MLPTPALLTITEAADQFRVSVATIRRWITEGRLDTVRLPSGRRRIRQADIDALLRGEPTSADPEHTATRPAAVP